MRSDAPLVVSFLILLNQARNARHVIHPKLSPRTGGDRTTGERQGLARTLGAILVCAASLSALPAQAQDSGTAEALFKRGLQELDAGRLEGACPLLAESFRIDSRPGTLFTLAECEAQAGKLASAIAHYSDYLQLFSRMPPDQRLRQQGREKIAHAQVSRLAPLVPQLIILLPANAPEGTRVRRDDVVLQRPSLGLPLPVDPGEHVITTQGPDGAIRSIRVSIAQGETKRVVLAVDASPPAAAVPGAATQRKPDAPSTDRAPLDRSRSQSLSGQRIWSLVLGGLALEGLAIGAVSGAMAWDKKQIISRECSGNVCSQEGKDAGSSAHALGTVSTLTFGVGLAALAGAIVLWTTDRPATETKVGSVRFQPTVASDGHAGMLGVRGGF
ncbi:MAG: hypothetical protein HY898_00110 [Deltaproteobacteria bacterium]|nr:hypothetical protein [Deltaproteobacteria bacterium]